MSVKQISFTGDGMIDKKMQIGDLYAFYGQLLTGKQQEIIELYIYEDLSLGEISEHLEITRQAVFDMVKRSAKTLEKYETKLGLVARFKLHRDELEKINKTLVSLRDQMTDNSQTIDELIESVNKLID
jgi:hypothetical protein